MRIESSQRARISSQIGIPIQSAEPAWQFLTAGVRVKLISSANPFRAADHIEDRYIESATAPKFKHSSDYKLIVAGSSLAPVQRTRRGIKELLREALGGQAVTMLD